MKICKVLTPDGNFTEDDHYFLSISLFHSFQIEQTMSDKFVVYGDEYKTMRDTVGEYFLNTGTEDLVEALKVEILFCYQHDKKFKISIQSS